MQIISIKLLHQPFNMKSMTELQHKEARKQVIKIKYM